MSFSGFLVPTQLTALLPPDRPGCPQPATALLRDAGGNANSRRTIRSRRETFLMLLLVAVAHVAGALSLARLAPAPRQPDSPPIVVALITPPGDVATRSTAPAEQATAPALPESTHTTPAPPESPPPEPERITPPPVPRPLAEQKPPPAPKPRVTDKPRPKPRPTPAVAAPRPQVPPAAPAPTPPAVVPSAAPTQTSSAAAEADAKAPPDQSAGTASAQLTPARFDAGYLNNPPPAYPPLARRMQEQGKVLLRVLVSAEGKPGKIELSSSSGSDRLDQAARAAVARWRFIPARQGDRDVETWVIVPIIFKLEGS